LASLGPTVASLMVLAVTCSIALGMELVLRVCVNALTDGKAVLAIHMSDTDVRQDCITAQTTDSVGLGSKDQQIGRANAMPDSVASNAIQCVRHVPVTALAMAFALDATAAARLGSQEWTVAL